MWGSHAAAPLNSVHLGYGLGAILINLLVRPYITKQGVSIDNQNIVVPYSVTATLCFIIALGHLAFYISKLRNRQDRRNSIQIDYAAVNTNADRIVTDSIDTKPPSAYSPRTCGHGDFQYGLLLSIIFMMYTFFIGGSSQTFSKFFFSYLKSDRFQISTEEASSGMIIFWFSFSVGVTMMLITLIVDLLSKQIGRLTLAIISVYVSVTTCLTMMWFGALALSIAWLIFVWMIGLTFVSLSLLGAVTGFILSPIFPLSFGFFNQQLKVIPMLLALLLSGTAFGAMSLNKIAGR